MFTTSVFTYVLSSIKLKGQSDLVTMIISHGIGYLLLNIVVAMAAEILSTWLIIKSKVAIFVIPFRTSSFKIKLTMSKSEAKTRGDEVTMLAELAYKYLARARDNTRENWADLLKVLF